MSLSASSKPKQKAAGALTAEDKKLISYIRKKLKEPWRGFLYSEVKFLFGKLLEAGVIR
jgi:hypothetical protein